MEDLGSILRRPLIVIMVTGQAVAPPVELNPAYSEARMQEEHRDHCGLSVSHIQSRDRTWACGIAGKVPI